MLAATCSIGFFGPPVHCSCTGPGGTTLLSHVRLKPVDGAAHQVPGVLGIVEAVTFTRVDDELSFHAERFERVPEFVALRRRTLAVPLADYNERWGLYVLDEGDG